MGTFGGLLLGSALGLLLGFGGFLLRSALIRSVPTVMKLDTVSFHGRCGGPCLELHMWSLADLFMRKTRLK